MSETVMGAMKLRHDLAMIAARAVAMPEVASKLFFKAQEKEEAALFAAHAPRHVASGATRASLTESGANGAIRERHGESSEFGTSIPYAIYEHKPEILVRHPHGVTPELLRLWMAGI